MKKMKVCFFLWAWCLISLHAQNDNEPLKIHSGEVSYDGQQFVLVGQVDVQHELGSIQARHLSIGPTFDKKYKFGLLEMTQDVSMHLQTGGRLTCHFAQINYADRIGRFTGNGDQLQVIYSLPPVKMASDQMQVDLIKEKGQSSKTLIEKIQAQKNVLIEYGNATTIQADVANYTPLPLHLLSLFASATKPCLFTHEQDAIEAKRVDIDIENQSVNFQEPQGKFKPTSHQTLQFSAHELQWNQKSHTLELNGLVEIDDDQLFHLSTPNQVLLKQELKNGKQTFSRIESLKETCIKGVFSNQSYQMTCPGILILDYQKNFITLQKVEGEREQVKLKSTIGDLYADLVEIKYQMKNGQLVLEKMQLKGDVKLLKRTIKKNSHSQKETLHYALADSMEYHPVQSTILLSAKEGHRVLFYDQMNNVQMSAPSLKVSQKGSTEKQVIQGIGDVRFTFIENEMSQIKKIFQEILEE